MGCLRVAAVVAACRWGLLVGRGWDVTADSCGFAVAEAVGRGCGFVVAEAGSEPVLKVNLG